MVNLLSVLNVFEPHIPDYAAMVLLELHKDVITNQYGIEASDFSGILCLKMLIDLFFKIYYKASPSAEAKILRIPDCDSFCPISKLIDLTKSVIPENWDKECATDDRNYVVPPPKLP